MTLHDHVPSISFGGRPLCNQRFADDIDLMEDSARDLQDLTNKLVSSASTFGMGVSAEKPKVMFNILNGISANFTMNGQPQEEVSSFK